MKQRQIFCALVFLTLAGCKPSADKPVTTPEPNPEGLIFQSGFESNSTIIGYGADADIIGADRSLPSRDDWEQDLDNHPDIGEFWLQYQGGNEAMRYAKIVDDPTNAANKVLQFWLNEPNVEQYKGRVQANLYNNKGFKEFYQSVRVFFPAVFETVKTYPNEIRWLTIAEYWNNITWNRAVQNGFRVTLGIGKQVKTESDLYFMVDAQDGQLLADDTQKYTDVWSEVNTTVKVPIGKWVTLETYFKEGNKENGRFYMAMTPEGGSRQVVFDVKNITHNTTDPAPNGISDFNPLKLYTSKEMIGFMKSKGKTLQLYWDDFKIWQNKRPN